MTKERTPDPATETSCKHCGVPIRKRRDHTGNQFEWVTFLGMNTNGTVMYGRFCQVPGQWKKMRPVRQHSPIPIGNRKKLEEWLDN